VTGVDAARPPGLSLASLLPIAYENGTNGHDPRYVGEIRVIRVHVIRGIRVCVIRGIRICVIRGIRVRVIVNLIRVYVIPGIRVCVIRVCVIRAIRGNPWLLLRYA
jgi:hypothetical protein